MKEKVMIPHCCGGPVYKQNEHKEGLGPERVLNQLVGFKNPGIRG
jgi:hypothetical protein